MRIKNIISKQHLTRTGENYQYDTTTNRLIISRPAENVVTIVAFALTAASVNVSDRIWDGKRGIQRATVTLTDTDGNSRSVLTDRFGYYQFDNVAVGETFVCNVRAKYFSYNPQIITVTEELTNFNFMAQPVFGLIQH